MGALIMFGLVLTIAFVGGGYFAWQDNKKERQKEDCNKATNHTYTASDGGKITLDNGRATISRKPSR